VIGAGGFVLGLYMGWFRVTTSSADGTAGLTVTVDKDKIQQDKDQLTEKLQSTSQE
jgi:hypothetical protein